MTTAPVCLAALSGRIGATDKAPHCSRRARRAPISRGKCRPTSHRSCATTTPGELQLARHLSSAAALAGRPLCAARSVLPNPARSFRQRVEAKKAVEPEIMDDSDEGPAGRPRSKESEKFEEDFSRSAAEVASNMLDDAASDPKLKLAFCLLVDFIGNSSYLLPGIGEASDVAWAPVQAFILMKLFGSTLVSSFGFIEEALPGLDIVPTATIVWCIEHVESLKPLRDFLIPKDDK